MGQQQSSLIYTSRPKDVVRNIEWSLQELMRWESQAPEAKVLLLDNNQHDNNQRRLSGMESAHHEMNEAHKIRLEAVNTLLNPIHGNKKRRQYLSELDKSSFPMNTQAALGQSASEIFAAGAAAQVAEHFPSNNTN